MAMSDESVLVSDLPNEEDPKETDRTIILGDNGMPKLSALSVLKNIFNSVVERGTGASSVQSIADPPNTASGRGSTAFGRGTVAAGHNSFATGYMSQALGNASVAMGSKISGLDPVTAQGYGTVAIGASSKAIGPYSIAIGYACEAEGDISVVMGHSLISTGMGAVLGCLNLPDDAEMDSTGKRKYALIVGNGRGGVRSNGLALDWAGNEEIAGSLTLGKGTENEVTLTPEDLSRLLELIR